MKKVFALLLVSVFAIAMVGCGDDDSGGACTEEDAQACADDYGTCVGACDPMASDYLTCAEDCLAGWCDCLDAGGCDEYLDEAGCE